ncbi:MAG TPA: sugar kinase [Micromonosporaceae bacterium]
MSPTGPVLVVGDVVTDVVALLSVPLAEGSDAAARIEVTGGGSAANTAAWLARAGTDVSLVCSVGADRAGDAVLDELAGYGVRCLATRQRHAPTGTVIVLAGDGERSMVTDRGANLLLSADDVAGAATAARPAHLHLSGYPLLDPASRPAGLRALDVAPRLGATTSVDAASAAPLRRLGGAVFLSWVAGVDLLLANLDEARALLGVDPGEPAALAAALARRVRRAVVKCGAGGAVWAEAGHDPVSVPGHDVDVVDVTGAGDAFAAGLLAAWLGGAGPREALLAGTRYGALAVTVAGARPPSPSPDPGQAS